MTASLGLLALGYVGRNALYVLVATAAVSVFSWLLFTTNVRRKLGSLKAVNITLLIVVGFWLATTTALRSEDAADGEGSSGMPSLVQVSPWEAVATAQELLIYGLAASVGVAAIAHGFLQFRVARRHKARTARHGRASTMV